MDTAETDVLGTHCPFVYIFGLLTGFVYNLGLWAVEWCLVGERAISMVYRAENISRFVHLCIHTFSLRSDVSSVFPGLFSDVDSPSISITADQILQGQASQ